ncbi:SDR family oxidoreductase [Sphingomonas sp. MG17]|uniref:SDR family oxidoreductase n=1 Tax=Sphingomonas tagetis TaxID=2949092 RepID=A0A9X2HKK0_9SPHN|nr:SDR family oxidoreductase [Sphingomonas tagetis]MCP3731377.1 SDR family oxidoreductase [Sphingomonas tagetis]
MIGSDSFAGKSFILTGGGGDIGSATVHLLLGAGANVAVLDRSGDALARLKAEAATPDRLFVAACDVAAERDVVRYFAEARHALGAIHGIVNAAGIEGRRGPIDQYPVEMFAAVMSVNVTGVFLGIKHGIPLLRDSGGGAIVNACSTAGIKGVEGMAPYVASKHAVLGLTRSASLEWGRHGIRVNCVAPGPVEGRMLKAIYAEQADDPNWPSLESRKALNPSGRFGDPREIANVIAFLLSDASSFVNGACFSADGGVSAL